MVLAELAGDRLRPAGPGVEGPRGPLSPDVPSPSWQLLALLPDLLVDQEWGDALTIITSLDLDMEEAALDAGAERTTA